jgi:hypothetical protein
MTGMNKNAGAPAPAGKQAWIDALVGNQGIDAAVAVGRTVANAVAGGGPAAATMFKLPELHVGSAIRWGNLEWFPVWTSAPVKGQRRYSTDARPFVADIKEKSNPEVSGLEFVNKGDVPLLMFEGQLLVGGMQHRALTRTVFVPGKARIELPVICVEAGRWAGDKAQKFGYGVAPVRVKAAMRGLKRDGLNAKQSAPDQNAVWENIDEYQAKIGNRSNQTRSMVELQEDLDRNNANHRFPETLPGQRGVIIAIKGEPVALELFDHPETMQERLSYILNSFLADAAIGGFVHTHGYKARAFAARAARQGMLPTQDVGRYRNSDHKQIASEAIVDNGELLHLCTLNAQHELVLAA